MRLASLATLLSFGSICVLFSTGCPKTSVATGASEDAAADAAVASALAADAAASAEGGADDVGPVYPIETNAPAVPLAEKLCNGVTMMPEKKRAQCCKMQPGITFTSECSRQLSAALRHNALTVEEKDVDACIAAFEKTLDGCEWVGPFPPGPPAACQGIFKGKIALGQKCRSSLECVGELRCKGLGPTTPGTCTTAGTTGETTCGSTTDSLATYTRQNDVDKRHPECKERCIKHRCQAAASEGAACQISNDCQDGMQCVVAGAPPPKGGIPPKKCVAGKLPGKDGEACPGDACADGLDCVGGKCAAKKASGEACTNDWECRGGCIKSDGGKGLCGLRCDSR